MIRPLGDAARSGRYAAFSPDGKVLAVARHGIFLWEVATGKELVRLNGYISPWVCAAAFSPDGRMLASGGGDEFIRLWEMATGQERRRFIGHRKGCSDINALAFSPDGRILASGSDDTTILLWDVTGRPPRVKPREAELSLGDLAAIWKDMAGPDAARAYEGMCRLIQTPGRSVSFLRGQIRPILRPDPTRLARLIRDLDSDEFEVREKASEELAKLEEAASPALEAALREPASPEARRRLRQLLEVLRLPVPAPEGLRVLRAVEVLEHIGNAEARRLLAGLAEGAPAARSTREAKASLQRLAKWPAPAP